MVQSAAIGRIVRHPARDAESRESTALLVGATAFVLGAAVGLVVFWGRDVPLSGRGSLGDFVAIGGGIAAGAGVVARVAPPPPPGGNTPPGGPPKARPPPVGPVGPSLPPVGHPLPRLG